MKKRFTAVALAALMLMMAFALVACGGEKTIVGTWKTDDSEAAGLGELPGTLFFIFEKDGSARFELDLKGLDGDEKAAGELANGVLSMMEIGYEILSDTEIEMTLSVMGETDVSTVEYSLNGDTLVFEGVEFKRVK
ncbi:MAG: hypothetical protein IJP30_04255 [Clostridia bacterium]|nr:hypothetical protein [Clostridia bacterium]